LILNKHSNNHLDLSSLIAENEPFPHFYSSSALQNNLDLKVVDWLSNSVEWDLVETDFYEQHEFNLLTKNVPQEFEFLKSKETSNLIEDKFKSIFKIESFHLVGIVAHKLVTGQHIGIHNDFINGEETHRLVIHFNPQWSEENGGFLILFHSSNATDISKVINPIANFAFGFEISERSHHAVSRIYNYTRYTIVYTFKEM
jgi:Rps23 Pro-64 3,4-dihydroxylase Tpa1-like proline 4-hydroxylase